MSDWPVSRDDCAHPKGSRKDFGYMVTCQDCGAVISPKIPADSRFFGDKPLERPAPRDDSPRR